MRRYLNRIGIFKTSQVKPIDPSIVGPNNQAPAALDIDPKRGNRAKQQLIRQRVELASDFPEPKRTRFIVSDPSPPTPRNSRLRPMTVKLKSSDGKIFEVNGEALAQSSEKVRTETESAGWCVGDVIGVPDVDGRALAVAIEYAEKRFAGAGEEELKDWARAFFSADQPTFFDITLAAYHLKMKSLLDLTCETVTDTIRGKTPLEVKKILNIQGPFKLSLNSLGYMNTESKQSPAFVCVQSIWVIENLTFVTKSELSTAKSPTW
ncbi:hypothetical protein V2J09_014546 [Rumex salicifolius]